MLVEAKGRVILHERGWRAEFCAVKAIVELYAGNIVKHMQLLRTARFLGNPTFISLEDAIDVFRSQQRGYQPDGDWQADRQTGPRACSATCPAG